MDSTKRGLATTRINVTPVVPKEVLIAKSPEDGNVSVRYGTTDNGSATLDPEAGFRLSGSQNIQSSVISIHNCFYSVAVKTKACCGRTQTKTILKDLNGIFKPGMNAILGPTGSGKSSLLDVLAGRKDPVGLRGNLLLDGAPPPDNFKCMVGYVVQDDVVMGTLTVRENFQFSAALRLPSDTTKMERDARVNAVIDELGLTQCADTRVGNEFIRGVSGGERKRTNIGMELIISPPVLFLDEPTTGLDASTANAVMYLLRRLALKGRTIVFSIHQPRFSIYKVFDNLMLLSGGEVVYHGAAPDALQYFKSIGYICEEHNNPPDFFLDVINGDYDTIANFEAPDKKENENSNLQESLVQSFRQSQWHDKLMDEVTEIYDKYMKDDENGTVVRMPRVPYTTSFFNQLMVVSGRTVRNIIRNPQTSILQVFVMIIFGVIVGAIYFDVDDTASAGIQNRVGAFFFIIMNQVFGNLSAVELFIKERAIFMHENVSGFYRVSAYFLAKVFCDVIPMRLVPVTFFTAIVYWMIGLRSAAGYFFYFLLDLFLTALAASGLAFAISASVRIFAIANLLIALCYVFMMLFSGLLVNLSSIADWLVWLKWFSIFRYSLDALSINELSGEVFCDNGPNGTCTTGDEYLSQQGIAYETTWDLWVPQVALAAISLGFLILSYIQLRRLKKLK
ncbi:broad substrate specificity ATP-binding cassette transporter ABCG2-like [Haliotis rubra]|uniref:broad substrate specificity ATP-binding cassette transporter ABCG2-like n=1 Tax=Haliotis rubra TaxID=36100 RepID=UPI001EE4FD27|nr:broad substrate specificity ATP-binding cassette transporter ABCG2-like [Haliotis rubra]XP_046581397.1 broad substrate specificity ATP-binding cassette transporter ABCG2-like [Haliotis rubra]